MHFSDNEPVIAIYLATENDATELRRLAALDSKPHPPTGRVLLGVVDGRVHAAIGVDSGLVVADPFERTGDLVELLSLRAARINGGLEGTGSVPTRLRGALRRAATGARGKHQAPAAPALRGR